MLDLLVPEMFDRELNKFGRNFFGDFSAIKMDIMEKDGGLDVKVDLPGFNKEDISVAVENDCIAIKAEKKEEERQTKDKYVVRERISSRSVSRVIPIQGVKPEDVSAKFENGVLSLDVKKPEAMLPEKKMIAIE